MEVKLLFIEVRVKELKSSIKLEKTTHFDYIIDEACFLKDLLY
jgi:hypothetical protein